MWDEVHEALATKLRAHAGVGEIVDGLENDVRQGTCTPADAARRILERFATS